MPQAAIIRSPRRTPPSPASDTSSFSTLIGSQIRFLVSNLKQKNFKSTVSEIHHIIDLYGHEAYLLLLHTLIGNIDFRDQKGQKDQFRIQLLSQELLSMQKSPNLPSLICQALEGVESLQEEFLAHFSKVLKLQLSQEILVGLGLAHSVDAHVRSEGIKFLKNKITDLTPSALKSLPENILHHLLYFLRTNPDGFAKQVQTTIKAIQKNNPVPQSFSALISEGDSNIVNSKQVYTKEGLKKDPLIFELATSTPIADLMEDLGYSCCDTAGALRDILREFPQPLNEADVAKIIGMMARTHSNLEVGLPLCKSFADSGAELFKSDAPQSKTWNLDVFVDVMKETNSQLDWTLVMKNLDHPGFQISDSKGLVTIIQIWRKASKDPFPLDVLFGRWTNSVGQFSFLRIATTAPPDILSFASPLSDRIDAEGLPLLGKTFNQSWYSLSLIETLLMLAETENYSEVRKVFNHPIKNCPELLLLGLSQAKPTWNLLSSELSSVLMPGIIFSNTSTNSSFVIHKIWTVNPAMLIRGMIDQYTKDPSSLSRILEIATQDLKALPQILDARPFFFSIDLASLASRREFLLLEKWVQEKIGEHGDTFIKACVYYIKDRSQKLAGKNDPANQRIQDSLAIFFNCLQANMGVMTPDLVEEMRLLSFKFRGDEMNSGLGISITAPLPPSLPGDFDMQRSQLGFSPMQKGNNQGSAPNSAQQGQGMPADSTNRVFPPEVEELANAYFQKIYTGQITLDEIINLLKRFKNSKDQREQDIFACMIHNLFDEYRFFPKYPDKELQITGILFGSLIQHQLVSFLPLGVALRYVLDALRKPAGSKMFKFGLTALVQFKSRLAEWPQYCTHIMAIGHIRKLHPDVIDFIEKTRANNPTGGPASNSLGIGNDAVNPVPPQPVPQVAPQPPQVTPPVNTPQPTAVPPKATAPSVAETPAPAKEPIKPAAPLQSPQTLTKPDGEKAKEEIEAQVSAVEGLLRDVTKTLPQLDPNILDKFSFIFNNVSALNMDVKAAEMRELMRGEDYAKYLSYYLVVKRVCTEQNFHSLYIQFLDKIKYAKIFNFMLTATYESIGRLLRSDKIVFSMPDRTLLKNLGSWLGLITLARNKPILQRDLALKDLIFEGYEQGRLIAVVPFVCKVLEPAASSKVFKPPNPWVMALMRVLSEIYRKRNIRLNLKFEVEVLCRCLGLDINEVKPADLLKEYRQYTGPNNFDFNPPPEPEEPQVSKVPDEPAITEEGVIADYVHIAPNIPLFVQMPQLSKLVFRAIDRAVREIIQPVVERSVTIASITTRELVTKDFATEIDEVKMRKAAHLMVQNLAGSLALVTCKEPLRVSMSNHLRSILQAQTPEQLHPMVEQAVQILASDNLDLACTIIEKAATEKAVRDTDEALSVAFNIRRKHIKERGNATFFDPTFVSRYPAIPESLRPKLGGLMAHQVRVYDDFSRIAPPSYSQSYSDSKDESGEIPSLERRSSYGVDQADQLPSQLVMEKFNGLMNELGAAVTRNMMLPSLLSLPPDSEVFSLIKQVAPLLSRSAQKNDVTLLLAQKIFNNLYETDHPLYSEVLLAVLEGISEASKKIVREITGWVLYSADERKFNRKVISSLLRTQLLLISEFDGHLAKLLIDPVRNKTAFEFAIFLIKHGVVDHKYIAPLELRETLEAISRFGRLKGQEELAKLLDEVRVIASKPREEVKRRPFGLPALQTGKEVSPKPSGTISPVSGDSVAARDQTGVLFEEWMAIFVQPNQNDKAFAAFVTQLQQHPVMKDEESASKFFKTCIERCVERCLHSIERQNVTPVMYRHLDGFCKLAVLLVKHPENPAAKIGVLGRVLGTLVRVLIGDYDLKQTRFNQRPYFRLFANLLIDLNAPDPSLDPINLQILLAFSNAFVMLQPARLPGFSFAWLDLISHRMFMPKLLLSKAQKGWPLFQRLLVEMFRFMEPYLQNSELTDPVRILYKGTLRVLLVLLHDFPEFLCDYHFSFCDVIPPSCIQMRNLILSAFPRNMRLPDPFTPNLKVDLLPEINQSPQILSNYVVALQNAGNLKSDVDSYLKSRAPVHFLLDLRQKLLHSSQDAVAYGTKYNVPLLNSLVLYVGAQAIAKLQNAAAASPIAHSAPMDIFQHLAVDLDTEGRYLFLNAITNQLRYPNNHTHYFSCVLLYLFAEANQEIIQEQITRVLLERLIVNRPHPWGLLITFIELIKNPRYNFWSHSFTRLAPEIERLFESVARSCMHNPQGPKSGDE
eukprot:TRINITY_DN3247_c0_g1_i5.p1 TRINITY_DN3247_c0_g1~~TRINITY_DN3247_c0_g1_i5.p1  ORF type:complete len:2234 (+),score=701.16 TRINITY_DN3247_c0_g1_i5:75-6776(+)